MQSEPQQEREGGKISFSDSLREIQGEYMILGEIYEKQKSYAQELSELIRAMQTEVDTVIQIKPEVMPPPCRAAYLVSEGAVVIFGPDGGMTSKPLYALPSEVIVSIIQECAPELQRLLSQKRRIESNRVKSMERVLNDLKNSQFTLKSAKREEMGLEQEAYPAPLAEKYTAPAEKPAMEQVKEPSMEPAKIPAKEPAKEPSKDSTKEPTKVPAVEAPKSKGPFAFIGTFGKTGMQQSSAANNAKKQPEGE